MNKELNIKGVGVRNFTPSSIDKEKRTISLIASSETPYLRYDWDLGPYFEVLSHSPDKVDLSRLLNKAPYLYEHDPEEQIGVIEDVQIMNKQLLAQVRFSKNQFPDEVFNDIVDGIRNKNSIGYFVEEGEIIGYDEKTGYPIIEVRWFPFEISSVAIPADDTAMVLRSISKEEQKRSIKVVMKKDLVDKVDNVNTPEVVNNEVVEQIEPVIINTIDNQNNSDNITVNQEPFIEVIDNEKKLNQNIVEDLVKI